MKCHEINYILDKKGSGEPDADQNAAVDEHFATCRPCLEAWAAYREVSALQIPPTPEVLRSRITATSKDVRAKRVPLIVGGFLAIGAAVAAAVAFRITDDTSEHETLVEETSLAPARSPDGQERSPISATGVGKAAEPEANKVSDSKESRFEHALDPNTIVVVPVLHPELDPERKALFLRFYQEILRQLQAIPGLNVVRPEVVDLFVSSGTPEEEVARSLGAGHLVVLRTTLSDRAASFIVTPVDMTTGTATGKMGGSGPFDARWPARLESDAADVADFIKEGLTPFTPAERQADITEALAVVLNAALPARERVTALGTLSQRSPEKRTDAVVAAAVELVTIAPEERAAIWRAMHGVPNPYLIQPLIDSLSYDAADHVRRQAATSLRTFITEPRVKAILEQAQASDPSEVVREAAQRALSSDEEVTQRALLKLLDETLPVRERLMAMRILEGGNIRAVPLTQEAAQAVFDIGVTATDPGIRGSAWASLGRNDVEEAGFKSVLLDDLASYPDVGVRTMAANALAPYIDDPVVRAALERAEGDVSFEVRYAARRALGIVPD